MVMFKTTDLSSFRPQVWTCRARSPQSGSAPSHCHRPRSDYLPKSTSSRRRRTEGSVEATGIRTPSGPIKNPWLESPAHGVTAHQRLKSVLASVSMSRRVFESTGQAPFARMLTSCEVKSSVSFRWMLDRQSDSQKVSESSQIKSGRTPSRTTS
jgi:hypothetical protein